MDFNNTIMAAWATLLIWVLKGLLHLFGTIHLAFRVLLLAVWVAHFAYILLDHYWVAPDTMLFSVGAGYAALLVAIALKRTKLMR